MKKIILITILLFFVPFVTSYYAPTGHYEYTGESILLSQTTVIFGTADINNVDVLFNYDLNYVFGPEDPDDISDEGALWFTYTFHNWYASQYVDLGDGAYYEIQPEDPDSDIERTNFLGLPFSLKSCWIDCDYTGDPTTCENDGQITRYWDFYSNVVFDDVNTWIWDYISVEGWPPYTEVTVNELIGEPPEILLYPGSVRFSTTYTCEYDTPGVREVSTGCTLIPNSYYRHNSPEDSDWSYNEVIPDLFATTHNDIPLVSCLRTDVDTNSNNYNVYNLSANELTEILPYTDVLYDCENGICTPIDPGQTQPIYESPFSNAQDSATNLALQKQYYTLNEKVEILQRTNFQSAMLNVVEAVANLYILIYYLIVITLLVGFVFVQIPNMFRRILDKHRQMSQIKGRL